MIEKSIGLLRNLYEKRKNIVKYVKAIAEANDVIIITHKENDYAVMGNTSDDAIAIYMVGVATAQGYLGAETRMEGLTVDEYLTQPTRVALKHLEQAGKLPCMD